MVNGAAKLAFGTQLGHLVGRVVSAIDGERGAAVGPSKLCGLEVRHRGVDDL